ncbi:MAG TPA: hypothetical protein VFS55_03940, partial [Dokdonella sp.]|nr:hypothetical protein [Dokdonella sp.]
MKLDEALTQVVEEFDHVHPDGQVDVNKLDKGVLPTFVTAESGHQLHYTKKSLEALLHISHILYRASNSLPKIVGESGYYAMVRQAIADCYASGDFAPKVGGVPNGKACLKRRLAEAVAAMTTEFTHSFPAWTMNVEAQRKFAIGPVVFLTRDKWLDSVHFSRKALQYFAKRPGKGDTDWKRRVRELLAGKARPSKSWPLADWVYRAIKDAPSVLKVKVIGSERALSRQRARYAARTALDCLALLFQDAEHHAQFVLGDDRVVPVSGSTLIESRGHLWVPGSGLKLRGWTGAEADAIAAVASPKEKKLLKAAGAVIRTLLDPLRSKHPQLIQRWATALAVASEGCRETHDGLALAKLASSLDILSGGGMEKGIRAMLLHQTGHKANDVMVKGPAPMTFKEVVNRIY